MAAEICTKRSPLDRIEMTLLLERSEAGSLRFKKVIKVNGANRRVMDIVGMLNVVLFLPRDLMLVEGSPSDRRRFINDTLAQVDRDYLQALNTYEKILPQRNALLRRIGDKRATAKELDYWDEKLIN